MRALVNLLAASAICVFCLALGCGGSAGIKAKGALKTKSGAPVTVSEKGLIQIFFYADGETEAYVTATVERDGKFELSKAVAPGKYKVAVKVMDPFLPTEGTDKLGGRYVKPADRIPVEVSETPIELTVDLK